MQSCEYKNYYRFVCQAIHKKSSFSPFSLLQDGTIEIHVETIKITHIQSTELKEIEKKGILNLLCFDMRTHLSHAGFKNFFVAHQLSLITMMVRIKIK